MERGKSSDSNFVSDFLTSVNGDFSTQSTINAGGMELLYESNSGWNRIHKVSLYGKNHILKSLKNEFRGVPLYESALNKEFNIGFQMEHPNICRTINWIKAGELGNAIIMEYIDGITLDQFICEQRLTPKLALKFIDEICDALSYLHSKQVVHRDLKPENILITHNGSNVKIIDFSLSDSDSHTILKFPAGTRHYLAPEVLDGESTLDLRSDIYSFGIVMKEMAELLGKSRVSTKIKEIAQICVQRDPLKRPSSAEIKAMLSGKRRTLPLSTAIAAIVAAIMTGVFIYSHFSDVKSEATTVDEVHSSSISYGGNLSFDTSYREILGEITYRTDTTILFNRLEEALKREFPLKVQQEGKHYKATLKYLKQEALTIYSNSSIE